MMGPPPDSSQNRNGHRDLANCPPHMSFCTDIVLSISDARSSARNCAIGARILETLAINSTANELAQKALKLILP
jgi:hypothetical protein